MDILPSSCREYSRHTWTFCLVPTESIPGIHGHSSDFRYFTQRIFPKWQLSKGIFPSGNFPNVQFPKSVLGVLALVLGLYCSLQRHRMSNLTKNAFGISRKDNAFGKMPLGKCLPEKMPLGKRFWENAFRKIANTVTPI